MGQSLNCLWIKYKFLPLFLFTNSINSSTVSRVCGPKYTRWASLIIFSEHTYNNSQKHMRTSIRKRTNTHAHEHTKTHKHADTQTCASARARALGSRSRDELKFLLGQQSRGCAAPDGRIRPDLPATPRGPSHESNVGCMKKVHMERLRGSGTEMKHQHSLCQKFVLQLFRLNMEI